MRKIAIVACALFAAAFVAVPLAGARTHSARTADASASGLDKEYLKTGLQGDLFEIIGGKLALKHSSNPAVRRLAKRLIKDHSSSFSDAAKLAKQIGVEVPKTPTPSEVWELSIVRQLHGKAFNRWYSSLEIFDHVQDIQEATDEVKDGSDPDVIKDAKTELPMLREHLKLSRAAFKASK